jgi:hypothetical protein
VSAPHDDGDESAADARARRLYVLAVTWGVVTLALLWLFARTFRA